MRFSPKSFSISVFLFLITASKIYADTGCLVTLSVPENRIYFQQYPGSQSNPVRFFTSTYYNVACPVGANASNQHPGNISNTTSPGTVCWAEFNGGQNGTGTNPNNAGNYRLNGFLVNYTMVACPLDNYALVALSALAGVACYYIRKS